MLTDDLLLLFLREGHVPPYSVDPQSPHAVKEDTRGRGCGLNRVATIRGGSPMRTMRRPTHMAPRTCLALLLGALMLVASGSAATSADWPEFHFNAAHTGFNAGEKTLTRKNVSRLRQAWAAPSGSSTEGSVAVGGG